jgi:CheY-like chemotaxis protein
MLAERREPPIVPRDGPALDPSLTGARVVVVDDDPTATELIREVLVQAGGEVIECRTSDEALRAVMQRRPDVVVSDIEMPGQDGYSLIRKLRALGPEQGGKTPAVALTAFGRPEDRIRSLRAGFNIHVTKPVDPIELTVIVASMLGRSG